MKKTYKQTQKGMDPILSSLAHLDFAETESRLIGSIKKDSAYADTPFRSVAYKGRGYSNADAKNAIANDFYYSIIWKSK